MHSHSYSKQLKVSITAQIKEERSGGAGGINPQIEAERRARTEVLLLLLYLGFLPSFLSSSCA